MENIRKLLEILDSPQTTELCRPKWISVEEKRKPEASTEVLGYMVYSDEFETVGFHRILRFDGQRWESNSHCDERGVTHWMPLPTPPDKELK